MRVKYHPPKNHPWRKFFFITPKRDKDEIDYQSYKADVIVDIRKRHNWIPTEAHPGARFKQ